jgi:hypothetical protein
MLSITNESHAARNESWEGLYYRLRRDLALEYNAAVSAGAELPALYEYLVAMEAIMGKIKAQRAEARARK